MYCMQTPTRLRALWHCYDVCAPSGLSEYLEWHLASLAQIHTQIQNNKAARTLEAKASRKTEEPWRKRSSKKKAEKETENSSLNSAKLASKETARQPSWFPFPPVAANSDFQSTGCWFPIIPLAKHCFEGYLMIGNQRLNWMGYPVELNEMLWIFQFQKWDK